MSQTALESFDQLRAWLQERLGSLHGYEWLLSDVVDDIVQAVASREGTPAEAVDEMVGDLESLQSTIAGFLDELRELQ